MCTKYLMLDKKRVVFKSFLSMFRRVEFDSVERFPVNETSYGKRLT